MIINNIGRLKDDLKKNNWHMTAFVFFYKGRAYDVLFENNENIETRKEKLASVLLTFIDTENPKRQLITEANQIKMYADARSIREFFNIAYSNNLGDILKQLFSYFVSFVPATIPPILEPRLEVEINQRLASRGAHNPNAIYCYDARRLGKKNGEQMHRSIYIDNLTRRRRPELYNYFAAEKTVTFFYSEDPADELQDIDIIDRFAMREASRR